ncbi:hypothetical protein KZ288_27770, partial [Escherichia coli]|nr:hypothetical protein [Escherichia coli]
VGTGMGFSQLSQFVGGATGVALTGVAIVWQKSLPIESMFQNLFIGMTVLIVVSFMLFLGYKRFEVETSED